MVNHRRAVLMSLVILCFAVVVPMTVAGAGAAQSGVDTNYHRSLYSGAESISDVYASNHNTTSAVQRVSFQYGTYGGNLNLEINGDRVYDIGSFAQSPPNGLDGATVGGASVSVTTTNSSSGEVGTVEITGNISSFSLGGQEMWIDNVEFGPQSNPDATVTFTTLNPNQSTYTLGDTFTADGVDIEVISFIYSSGTDCANTSGGCGFGEQYTSTPPNSGGNAPDFYPGNVNLRFDLSTVPDDSDDGNGGGEGASDRIGFDYVDLGGTVNLEVNGVRKYNQSVFSALDGTSVGGVSVNVTTTTVPPGSPVVKEAGHVELSGPIETFAVGGQETSVDNIEFGPRSNPAENVTFDSISPNKSQYTVGDSPTVDGVPAQIIDFTFFDGTVYQQGAGNLYTKSTQPPGGSAPSFFQGNTNIWFNVSDVVSGADGTLTATREIETQTVPAGETTNVSVSIQTGATSDDLRFTDGFNSSLSASVRDDDGATISATSSDEVTASWGGVSDATITYEVTVPGDASEGTTYDFAGTVEDRDAGTQTTIDGDSALTVGQPDPVDQYRNDRGVVGSQGLLDAAADFRAGEIDAVTLLDVAAAFRSGEPVT